MVKCKWGYGLDSAVLPAWYAAHPYNTYPSTYYTIYTVIGYRHCRPTHGMPPILGAHCMPPIVLPPISLDCRSHGLQSDIAMVFNVDGRMYVGNGREPINWILS
jgi:hypothetical protein